MDDDQVREVIREWAAGAADPVSSRVHDQLIKALGVVPAGGTWAISADGTAFFTLVQETIFTVSAGGSPRSGSAVGRLRARDCLSVWPGASQSIASR